MKSPCFLHDSGDQAGEKISQPAAGGKGEDPCRHTAEKLLFSDVARFVRRGTGCHGGGFRVGGG